jgi:hypothetical protein
MAHFFAVGLYVLDKYEAYTFNKKIGTGILQNIPDAYSFGNCL